MKDLKIPFFTILFIFLGLFLFTKLSGPIPFFLNNLQTIKSNMFHVQGTGKAVAAPDIASVTIGITQDAITIEEAQTKVNTIMNKIIDDVKKLGVEEKNIKTQNYSVYPKYNYLGRRDKIDGYTVSQSLEIKVKPIEKVNKVIDVSTNDGANIVNGASFIFSDELRNKLEDKARKDAVKDAKTKAESLANAAGLRLGRVIDVSESTQNTYPRPLMEKALAPIGGGATESEPATTITPGENSVDITVDLTYETY